MKMFVRRDNLGVYLPVLFRDSPEFGTHLVVEYLKVGREAFGGETLNYLIVGRNTMFVVPAVKAGVEDALGVALVGNHDVLIVTANVERESVSVIGLQFSDVYFSKINLFL